MTNNRSALIIFVKNPVMGYVKTRIAKDVGKEQALDIYKQLLHITSQMAQSITQDVIVYYSDEIVADLWDSVANHKKVQSGADLGERMKNAFSESFRTYDRLFLIGSDCPYISGDLIESTFHKMDHNELVIGPVKDGGYYGIGMKSFNPILFDGIEWSTEHVLRQTIAIAQLHDLQVTLLQELTDIDHYQDWLDYTSSASL